MILTQIAADKKLRRMALEIMESNFSESDIIVIGIKENGYFIAKKMVEYITPIFKGNIKLLGLSIDKKNPKEVSLTENIDLENKIILLIDDVANSGRTMLYALKPLLDKHPKQIQTLALLERTHKLFPIALNYVGLSVSTTLEENIEVLVNGSEVIGAVIKAN